MIAKILALVALAAVLAGCGPEEQRPQDPPQVTYRNCDEVREAGAAPLHSGDPGYSRTLDRDGDGIACEVES